MKSEDKLQQRDEAFTLFEKAIEGKLSPDDAARLDELVTADSDIRVAYLEYTHQHACLHWDGVSVSDAGNRDLLIALGDVSQESNQPAAGSRRVVFLWARWVVTAVALLAVSYYGGFRKGTSESTPPVAVATIVETKTCTWGAGSLPTGKGSLLSRGNIKLVSGLAMLRFVSGVEVTLEAPVELELVNSMECVLHEGTLVAKVPPEARGFVVNTASAHLVDHGTEFGVFVDRMSGTTDVQVFDGIVDVEQRTTRKRQRMVAGQRTIIDQHRIEHAETEMHEAGPEDQVSTDPFADAISITTSSGKGRDAFLSPGREKSSHWRPLLFVKASSIKPEHVRRAYLAFDLELLAGRKVKQARLRLQIERSEKGYASLVPDATFAVYGITDESLDAWSAEGLRWANAPAAFTSATDFDPVTSRLLGRFTIPQGTYDGFVSIEDDALLEFLSEDTNGVATMIIVRETLETRGGGLVHAFAGRNHSTGIPPTLLVLTD